MTIMSSIEVNTGIICSCLPLIKGCATRLHTAFTTAPSSTQSEWPTFGLGDTTLVNESYSNSCAGADTRSIFGELGLLDRPWAERADEHHVLSVIENTNESRKAYSQITA